MEFLPSRVLKSEKTLTHCCSKGCFGGISHLPSILWFPVIPLEGFQVFC